VEYYPLELSDPKSIERLAADVGDVDILINNAGVSQIGSVEEISLQDLRHIMEVNVIGTIYLTKLFLPRMRKKGRGFILNITSFASTIAVPFSTIYAVTKHAIDGLSKGLWQELRASGVTVVSVAPVHVKTNIPMIATSPDDSPYAAMIKRVKEMRDKGMSEAPDPDWIAKKVVRIIKSRHPAPSYIVGKSSRLYWLLDRALSKAAILKLVRWTFKVDK
jgi:short-subunit dehydrogenase